MLNLTIVFKKSKERFGCVIFIREAWGKLVVLVCCDFYRANGVKANQKRND
jgi:hypothetical protein